MAAINITFLQMLSWGNPDHSYSFAGEGLFCLRAPVWFPKPAQALTRNSGGLLHAWRSAYAQGKICDLVNCSALLCVSMI